jgi:hypothetical protein
VILGGGKPANARLVAAAIRDTREAATASDCPPAALGDRFGSKADLTALKYDFRCAPDSGHCLTERPCPKNANSRHAGHRSLSAADVNAHGRLAARYDHLSTRGHKTGRGHPATFRCPDFRGAAGDHQR